ncbi:GMC family oxidoreductase [Amycolatopsis sp. NPDC059021]|uniref:GMC family oxidoreductase n=1 Tax=Amycolatopsis sp. NPDC059021 TaxID=3346704 RepID=UPI00366B78B3
MIDYIVVGAGSAGCVLANRLTERGDRAVLLMEAGPPDARSEIRIPAAYPKVFGTEYDWDFRTVAQPGLNGRELRWPRGRTLGGSAAINAQIWTRGHPADFDEWARAGGPEWRRERVRGQLVRAERPVPGDGSGPLWVGPLRDPDPRAREFVRSCGETGLATVDGLALSEAEGSGLTWVSQHEGQRFSVADGYLRPALERGNLTVRAGTCVRRILFDGTRAVGIEYEDADGVRREEYCRREVILAAGAIGSPHLLLVSGIGPPGELARREIPVLVAAPDVGAHLVDHLQVPVIGVPSEAGEPAWDLRRYVQTRRGPLSSNLAEAAAFVRLDPAAPGPDVELLWMPVQFRDHGRSGTGAGSTVCVVLLRPRSRGRLGLAAADIATAPTIDPRYLADPADTETLVAGIRFTLRVLSRFPADAAFEPETVSLAADAGTGEIRDYISHNAETLYHPAGTCRMGQDPASVVDPRLEVRGVTGLRVADASVMPHLPAAHPNAATVAIAENAARLILEGTRNA